MDIAFMERKKNRVPSLSDMGNGKIVLMVGCVLYVIEMLVRIITIVQTVVQRWI